MSQTILPRAGGPSRKPIPTDRLAAEFAQAIAGARHAASRRVPLDEPAAGMGLLLTVDPDVPVADLIDRLHKAGLRVKPVTSHNWQLGVRHE